MSVASPELLIVGGTSALLTFAIWRAGDPVLASSGSRFSYAHQSLRWLALALAWAIVAAPLLHELTSVSTLPSTPWRPLQWHGSALGTLTIAGLALALALSLLAFQRDGASKTLNNPSHEARFSGDLRAVGYLGIGVYLVGVVLGGEIVPIGTASGESLPGFIIIAGDGFAFWFVAARVIEARVRPRLLSQWTLGTVTLLVIYVLFGGLRGSRTALFFPLLLLALLWRARFRTSIRLPIAIALMVAVPISMAIVEARSGYRPEDLTSVALGDLARVDITVATDDILAAGHIDPALGRTYLVGPSRLLPGRFFDVASKGSELTIVEYGETPPINAQSLRVLGTPGEALLNFGRFGFLLSFPALVGMVGLMGWLRTKMPDSSGAHLAAIALVLLPAMAVISDSDNLVPHLFRFGLLPVLPQIINPWRRIRPKDEQCECSSSPLRSAPVVLSER